MAYCNILVHVDNSVGAKARITAAATLASRFNCPLTGAFLSTSKMPSILITEAISPMSQGVVDGYLAERAGEIEKMRAAAQHLFTTTIGKAAIKTHWLDIDCDTNDQLVASVRRHDLAILPPEMTPALSDASISAARIGLASGGPVIVLRQGGYQTTFGKKILIAWNDSREAMRAIRDAWPFLETAEEIHFLKVSRDADEELDPLMLRLLQDHGCPAPQLHVDRGDEIAIADLIRLHAGRTGADHLRRASICDPRPFHGQWRKSDHSFATFETR